jgi:lipopolysaccharide biosynthesis glycosyltransferase
MNNIFREEILLLPSQFNCMVGIQRKQHISELRECIYHYAGDDGRPHYLFCDAFDTLFWQHFRMTPWYHDADKQHFWQEKSLAKQEQIRWLCDSEQKIRGRKKIFWGAGGCLHDAIRSHFQAQDGDYYIDTLQEKWGKRRAGLPICSPAALTAEKRGTFAIIVVTMQYVEVARKLQACGLVENEDFFDGRKFVPERAGGYPDWAIV